jgi:hypothetical protein
MNLVFYVQQPETNLVLHVNVQKLSMMDNVSHNAQMVIITLTVNVLIAM